MEVRSAMVESESIGLLPPIQVRFERFCSGPSFVFEEAPGDLIRASQTEVPIADRLEFDIVELEAVLSSCVYAAQDRKESGAYQSALSRDQLAALLFYAAPFSGNSFHALMNKELNSRRRLDAFLRIIWLIMQALKSCSPFDGRLIFRGMKAALPAGKYLPGHTVTWHQFSSCTADVSVQRQFLGQQGDRTLFEIELTTEDARSIAPYSHNPDEKEVLLQPNTRFEVTGVVDGGNGLTVIQLKELPCRDPILLLHEQLTMDPPVKLPKSSSNVSLTVEEPPVKQRRLNSSSSSSFSSSSSSPSSSSFTSTASSFSGCCRETGGDAAECRFLKVH